MQKIKNPILCWIVILTVFIRPTPAQAMVPLAVVAVGAVIAATGVMVAGAGVYKPPTFAQVNAVANAVTGDIQRKVIVARAFGSGVNQSIRGFESQYTLDFGKAYQWVKDHLPDYPALGPAATAGTVQIPIPGGAVGDVFAGTSGNRKILTLGSVTRTGGFYAYPGEDIFVALKRFYAVGAPVEIGGQRLVNTAYTLMVWGPYEDGYVVASNGNRLCYASTRSMTTTATTDPVYPVPATTGDPQRFAAAYPQTQAGQDETDKIAGDNPSAIKQPPAAMTPDQIKEASKQAETATLQSAATTAEAAAAADPTNTALQIAAQQARAAADLAAIQSEAAQAELEATPEEEEKTDTPPPAGPAPDADLALDFSPFLGLQDKAMSKFPFSLVSSLGSLFSGLTSAPVTPSMDVPMPWGMAPKQITLSHWDDFAGKWRMMIALFFHASCIYAIIRRYS